MKRDHGKALDELRAECVRELQHRWHYWRCIRLSGIEDVPTRSQCHASTRRVVDQIRALEAMRSPTCGMCSRRDAATRHTGLDAVLTSDWRCRECWAVYRQRCAGVYRKPDPGPWHKLPPFEAGRRAP